MTRLVLVFALVAMVAASTGCFDLDSFVWNPRQCSVVDPQSTDCSERHVCTPCDKPYPFADFDIPVDAVKQVTVKIAGGQTLDSYFITSSGARPDDVVVYAHGNFGSIEHYLNRLKLLYEMGVNIYAIDYRGFGKSSTTDEPDEPTFMDDVHHTRAALDDVLQTANVASPRIVDYGYSAGALAAVEMARTSPPCGLVLEAPFPSVQSFADDSSFIEVPQSFITSGSWDDIAKMPSIHAPLLQLHGSADDFIRFDVGRRVFDAANQPKQLIEVKGAGHGNGGNDIPTVLGDEYATDIEAFLDALQCD